MALGLLGLAGGVLGKLAGKAGKWAVKQAVGSGAKKTVSGTIKSIATTTLAGYGAGTVAAPILKALVPGPSTSVVPSGFGPDLNPFGSNDKSGTIFGFGGKMRRARRVNYTNMRALKKSIRRVQGFEKLAREVFTIGKSGMTLKKGRRR